MGWFEDGSRRLSAVAIWIDGSHPFDAINAVRFVSLVVHNLLLL